MTKVSKVDVPSEHWDRLYSPVACAVMITTVDKQGRVNAASFATCVRQNHEPTCISFTVEIDKDTYHNKAMKSMGNGDLNHSGLVNFVAELAKTELTQLLALRRLNHARHLTPIRSEKWPASVTL